MYDPLCPKLTQSAYSATYLDMLNAVVERFVLSHAITHSCSAVDIEADVILIYDIHSSHKIHIDGLSEHKALKYTYFNDPHQRDFKGRYRNGPKVHKLGAEQRVRRAVNRGIDYVICPYKSGYFEHIAPWLSDPDGERLFWFPPAPSIGRFPRQLRTIPLAQRKHKILGNGILHGGSGAYDFRRWAFKQKNTYYVKHATERPNVPKGLEYVKLLCQFAGALALCDWYVVPKYLEIPLAGCVCFAQPHPEYADMGFVDGVHYLSVCSDMLFNARTEYFLTFPEKDSHQCIADAGRKLIEDKWTAECFASAFYNHALERVQSNSKGQ